jgi:putative salt-induced outer membrane protein YdiY
MRRHHPPRVPGTAGRVFLFLVLAAGLLGAPLPGAGAETPATAPWAPPPPPPDDFDWIQLKSGEWLKGRLKGLQDNTVEFDSEELDDLTLDLKDIHVIRSGKPMSVRFEDERIFEGMIIVDQKTVIVNTALGTTANANYTRSQLQTIAPGGDRERDHWTGKVSVGINATSGNTASSSTSASIDLQRRTPKTSGRFSYLGNYGRLDGVENVNNDRTDLTFDVLMTKKFFLRPIQLSYYRDVFQNLSYRSSLGVSAGYYFYNRPDFRWQVTGGPAYQATQYISVEPGEDSRITSPSAVFSSSLEKDLTSRLSIELAYELTYTDETSGGVIHHSTNTLEIDLTKTLDLDVVFTWDRVGEPQAAEGGTIPEKDDFRLNLMLGYDF